MKIEGIRTLAGANVYSHSPVLIMTLSLEELAETASTDIPGFVERLVALLPGLMEHRCSRRKRGGFVERLHEGTYFAHIVEHVALELTEGAGIPVSFGKARYAGPEGTYHVIVEFKSEAGMRYLLETAVELVETVVRGEEFPLAERLKRAARIVARNELGPSTQAIVDAARRRNIPWARLNESNLVQLGYGKHRRMIQAAMSDGTSAIGMEIVGDKDLTKSLLDTASIPVPDGKIVTSPEEALEAFRELGAPVVVKPLDGRQGKGVSLNLTAPEEVLYAFEIAKDYSPDVLVEELFEGRNYRVLVVGGRVVAASERVPCHVLGDGTHTIAELIELENQNPLRGEGHEKPLTAINKSDPILLAFMSKEGLTLEHVPQAGEMVMLCAGINLSTGGTAKDVTDVIHPSVARLCERAARVVGMDICGVDLVIKDIAEPVPSRGGGIIELNAAPGLRMHHYPSEGAARDVGAAIIEMLYPQGTDARVPLISVTGTNGKTTVTRMIGHMLQEAGKVVGMTTTDGIWIGGELVAAGDTTGPHSARTVLGDSSVEVAVLETARGGIVRRGLGYDWSDISILTNIGPDHIGQDGIESVEDIVNIKSLVAERVRAGGTLILNADDEHLARLTEIRRVREPARRIVYFSLREDNPLASSHRDAGGTIYFVRGGVVVEASGEAEEPIVEVSSVPVTMNGAAEFQVANIMAAIAAARAYGLTRQAVAASIQSFRSDSDNPGRANLYKVKGGNVLVDYGHNSDAFNAICRMAANWIDRRVTAIIGVPGDRDNSVIEEAGRVAARGFHRVIIKEDADLRGRKRGEVASLLCQSVNAESPTTECLTVLCEVEALSAELEALKDNQIVVVFYDQLAPVLEVLERHGAVPTERIGQSSPQAISQATAQTNAAFKA